MKHQKRGTAELRTKTAIPCQLVTVVTDGMSCPRMIECSVDKAVISKERILILVRMVPQKRTPVTAVIIIWFI
jgi:hypothetical protein